MTLKHFLFSALMLLSAGTAWADVEINETNFPDASFRNYLLSQDYGSDGKLTDEEIAGVTSINVSGTYFSPGTISSLKGIEFFTALEDLRCSDNQLNSLDVSGCTALTTLFCYNNQLTSLDVSKNTALTDLYSDGNQLTSLDVSKNIKLLVLFCYQNQIKGAAMDAFVASLRVNNYNYHFIMQVIYYENEQNVMTTTQVDAAKAKGWTPYYTDGSTDIYGLLNWYEYAGVDPSTEVNNVEAADADDSAPWYTINGVELTEKPTAPGIYIHGGKKVVVK